MIESELMSYIQSVVDKRLGKLETAIKGHELRIQEMEGIHEDPANHDQALALSDAGILSLSWNRDKSVPKPHPASNTQLKEERPWRLQSEVMVGGSEKITMDPENHTHLLTETPAYAVKEIADRLGRPEMVSLGHEVPPGPPADPRP